MPDFNEMLQQAQAMASRAMQMQEELAKREVAASAGGGMVTVRVNGKRELLSVQIAPEAIDPEDPSMVQDLVVAAVNEAMRQAEVLMKEEMQKLTGGLSIPGLM